MKRLKITDRLPLVAIWWLDHASEDSWGADPRGELMEMLAVGLLTHQDDKKIVIARAACLRDGDFEGTLTIHPACVTRIERIWRSPVKVSAKKGGESTK